MSKNHFIFDKNRCVACQACVVACINENGFQEPERWRNILSSNEFNMPGIPLFNISLACNHCENAVCMENCPALAYSRSPITGGIIHQADSCIGCKYCVWNCPYDAPKYNPIKGIIEKCNFCESRLERGEKPACASLCPTNALDFSFENNPDNNSQLSQTTPINTEPSIRIIELRKETGPKMDMSLFQDIPEVPEPNNSKFKFTALEEWPLVIFTLLMPILVAISASDIMVKQSIIIKTSFLFVAAIGAAFSLFHLGQKMRSWRALLNIRKSWLSREIFFFTLFFTSNFLSFFILDINQWIIISFGILLLISIDMLYKPVQWKWKRKQHSASVVLMALTYYALFNQWLWFLLILTIYRLLLYISRSSLSQRNLLNKRHIIRLLSLTAPLLLMYFDFSIWVCISVITIGEITDRISFYNELERFGGKQKFTIFGKT